VADLTEVPGDGLGGAVFSLFWVKERRNGGKKAGRARKTKLPLKQDLPFL